MPLPSKPRNPGQEGNQQPRPSKLPTQRPAPQNEELPGIPERPRPRPEPMPDLEAIIRQPSQRSEQTFESNKQAPVRREPIVNAYDEEDVFEALPLDEVDEDPVEEDGYIERPQRPLNADFEEPDAYEAPAMGAYKRRQLEEEQEAEEDYEAPQPKKKKPAKKSKNRDKNGQNLFVDEKKKSLKPFGASSGRKKLKTSDLDARKNKKRQAIFIQAGVIALLLFTLGFAVKNAFWPPPTLTTDDVVATVQETVEQTNFPLERGKGFATDFMEAFLEVNTDNIGQSILGYYYSGTLNPGTGENPNRDTASAYAQTVVYGPTVYGARPLTDTSANYTIAALVQPRIVGGEEQPPTDGSTARWEFFSVNIFYDVDADAFAITPDSPTLIPEANMLGTANVPPSLPLGTGDADGELATEVRSTVVGFLEGYRTATAADHTAIDQYVIKDATADLLTGLGGAYEFDGGDVESALTYEAFPSDDEVKVAATVRWTTTVGNETVRNTYVSHYVITLQSTADGGYLVSRMAPEYYVMDEGEE